MASALYPSAKELFLTGALDLTTDTIKAALIDTDTVSYSAAHTVYNDITSAVIGTPVTLQNPDATDGVFDADPVTFASVTGDPVDAVILYRDGGDPATDELIAFIDQGAGLPVTPNGNDITVNWDTGANKIFAL